MRITKMLRITAAGMIIITTVVLVSGAVPLSFSNISYQQPITQEEMEMLGGGGGATTGGTEGGGTTGGNATTAEVIMHLQEARTALENNDSQGAMMHLDLALNVLGNATQGSSSNITTTNTTTPPLASDAPFRAGGLSGGGVDAEQ
jgi:hypothetical protein